MSGSIEIVGITIGIMAVGAGVNASGAWGLRKVTSMKPSITGAALNGAVSGAISMLSIIGINNFGLIKDTKSGIIAGSIVGFFATMALAPQIGKAIRQPMSIKEGAAGGVITSTALALALINLFRIN